MIDTSPATPEELALVQRLQRWHNDNIVDGLPRGDWHVECLPDHAALLLREYVGAETRKFVTGGPGLVLRCAFCGEPYPAGTPDHKHAALEAHIRVCKHHPIGIENRNLRQLMAEMLPHIDSMDARRRFRTQLITLK